MTLLKSLLNKKKDDNKGSALVLVIIAIAFVGTLVAMLVYLVYFNYLMKFSDRQAKNNFYTAESALDIIKTGLESDVSDAMMSAYYTVKQSSAGVSPANQQADFQAEFQKALIKKLNIQSGNIGGAYSYSYYEKV